MRNYCLGFVFTKDHDEVVLVLKRKPDWQKGQYNGVGGEIELDENALDAQSREFREETGISIPPLDWTLFCTMAIKDSVDDRIVEQVFCFYAFSDLMPDQKTEEFVTRVLVSMLPANCIPNLRWLIPMAVSFFTRVELAKEKYTKHYSVSW